MSASTVLTSAPPPVAVEISARHIAAAIVERRGTAITLAGHAIEALPEGLVVPSLAASNLPNRDAVVAALQRVFDRLGTRPRRVGLVVPDTIAKVSLIKFEKVPARAHDLEQLVRWQVRKTAPFRIEDAQVTFTPGLATPEGGREFVVSLARRDIVQEYEAVCAAAGAHAGLVDLATFNVINLALSSGMPAGDWLLVHVTPDYASIAILRGGELIFFRNRASEGDASLADLVHQTAMYYEDRLSGGTFVRIVLAGASSTSALTGAGATRGPGSVAGDVIKIRRTLEERLNARVETIDQSSPMPAGVGPALMDLLAPVAGLAARAHAAAA